MRSTTRVSRIFRVGGPEAARLAYRGPAAGTAARRWEMTRITPG